MASGTVRCPSIDRLSSVCPAGDPAYVRLVRVSVRQCVRLFVCLSRKATDTVIEEVRIRCGIALMRFIQD